LIAAAVPFRGEQIIEGDLLGAGETLLPGDRREPRLPGEVDRPVSEGCSPDNSSGEMGNSGEEEKE
jgi:hypothetical protein